MSPIIRVVRRLLPSALLVAGVLLPAGVPAASEPGAPEPGATEREALLARLESLHRAGLSDSLQSVIVPRLEAAWARGDSTLALQLILASGTNHAAYGRALPAEPVLREALALAETLGDSTRICVAVRWLSVAVGQQGNMGEAHELYVRLFDLATAIGNREYEGWALYGLGWEAWTRGQTEDAVRDIGQAVELFEQVGQGRGEALAVNGLGNALVRLGRHAEARESYERAALLSREIGVPMVEAMAQNNLGNLELSLGDPGLAEESFRQAQEVHERRGHLRETIAPGLNIAICRIERRRYRDAAAGLESLLALCEQEGYRDQQAYVLNALAGVRGLQGRSHESAALFRRSLESGEDLPLRARVDALGGLAGVLAEMDSTAAALSVLNEGAGVLAGGTFVGLELQLSSQRGRLLFELGRHREALALLLTVDSTAREHGFKNHRVGALTAAARVYRALDRPDSALARLEEAAAVWSDERGLPADAEWRELRGTSASSIHTELADLLLEHPAGVPAGERAARAFDRLQVFKARTLLERILGPGEGWEKQTGRGALDIVTLATLQAEVLGEGELFLDAYLGPDRSLLFAVTRTECRAVRLPAEPELEPKLRRYHELLSASAPSPGDAETLVSPGLVVRRLLLDGVRDLVATADRIHVAPDGALNLLPLAVLPEEGGARLGDDREWVRVPSATILANLRRRSEEEERPRRLRVLAVAGLRPGGDGVMPGAEREVKALGRSYENVEERRISQTRSPPTPEDLAAYDVLHLATHAHADDQRPWNSAIGFGAGPGAGDLRAGEVAGLQLPARLVVLSSCESAAGGILSCEGVLGLSSAFLSAGVPTVLATLWPVDDAVTADLIERFYEELARNETAAGALRRAQFSVRERDDTRHPFYWAGFVLVGDGHVRIPLDERGPARRPLAIVLVLGILLVAGGLWWRHRGGRS